MDRLDQINSRLGHWHTFSLSESMQLTSTCRICNVPRVQPSIGYLINHQYVCPAAITRKVLEERPQGHNPLGIIQPFLGLGNFTWSLQHRDWVVRLEHGLNTRLHEQEPTEPIPFQVAMELHALPVPTTVIRNIGPGPLAIHTNNPLERATPKREAHKRKVQY